MNESSKSIVSLVGKFIRFRLFQSGIFKKVSSLNMLITLLVLLFSCADQPFEEELEDDYSSRLSLEVTKFVLVNAITHQDIGELLNNSTINSSVVNIRVEAQAESVVFQLSGTETHTQIESKKPFALKGDSGGKYNTWTPKLGGRYTLKVTPYPQDHGKGVPGNSITINFEVTNNSNIVAPTPVISNSTLIAGLLFDGYFNDQTIITPAYGSFTIAPWKNAMKAAIPAIQDFYITSSPPDAYAEMVNDGTNYVLRGQTVTGGGKRFQSGIVFKTTTVPPFNIAPLPVYHTSQRMKINGELAHLSQMPDAITSGANWFSIYETWMQRVSSFTPDGDPISRIHINIEKAAGVGQPLKLRVRSQFTQPAYKEMWSSPFLPMLPLDKWFTMDVYIKTGEGSAGQFKVTITEDGKAPYILCDIANTTTYPGHPEYIRGTINNFKLYFSTGIGTFMKNSGKKAESFYSDLKFYGN